MTLPPLHPEVYSRVLVIGGQGFLGFHICKKLSELGFDVVIGRRTSSAKMQLAHECIELDLVSSETSTIENLLSGFQCVIFCGGADDRSLPRGDAFTYFYKENVIPCLNLVEASKNVGVDKVIILGSYLAAFDRSHPEWELRMKHPYINSRYLQHAESVKAAKQKVQVVIVEIPYVFGASPGHIPLWKPLVKYINLMPLVFYTKGGTNIMAAEQVAAAVLGIVRSSDPRTYWTIGFENVSWSRMITMIAKASGKRRKVILLPNFLSNILAYFIKLYFKVRKREPGLDPYHYMDFQTENSFLNVGAEMEALSYGPVDMQETMNQMVKACQSK